MSDLQPIGTPLTLLDGVERHVLFTLSVVDDIQSEYDMTVPEVFQRTGNAAEQSDIVAFLALTLINHAIRRENRIEGTNKKELTLEYVKDNIDMIIMPQINRAIAKSYGYSVPEPDDEDGKDSDRAKEPNS
jgi:hypothetical protein